MAYVNGNVRGIYVRVGWKDSIRGWRSVGGNRGRKKIKFRVSFYSFMGILMSMIVKKLEFKILLRNI